MKLKMLAILLIFAAFLVSGCVGQTAEQSSDSDLSSDVSDLDAMESDLAVEDMDFGTDFGG